MQIFWIEINKLKYKNFFKEITKLEKQEIVFTPNPEILLKIKKDKDFKSLLQKASYLTPDGIGLFLAFQILDNKYSKILNTILFPYYFLNLFLRRKSLYKKYWDRICWSDLTHDLLKFANKSWTKITIIDLYSPLDEKKIESQKKFSKIIKQKFKNLDFDYFIYNTDKKEEIIEKIKKSDSKMLFSTLWMKLQEQSVIEIMEKCKNIKLWLWIGSSFDYFTWFQKRSPLILRKIWFEWLYRLITWPRKIDRLKRLYNAIFVFIFNIIKEK